MSHRFPEHSLDDAHSPDSVAPGDAAFGPDTDHTRDVPSWDDWTMDGTPAVGEDARRLTRVREASASLCDDWQDVALRVSRAVMQRFPTAGIGIAGSVARATHTHRSDVDILVAIPRLRQPVEVRFSLGQVPVTVLGTSPAIIVSSLDGYRLSFGAAPMLSLLARHLPVSDPKGALAHVRRLACSVSRWRVEHRHQVDELWRLPVDEDTGAVQGPVSTGTDPALAPDSRGSLLVAALARWSAQHDFQPKTKAAYARLALKMKRTRTNVFQALASALHSDATSAESFAALQKAHRLLDDTAAHPDPDSQVAAAGAGAFWGHDEPAPDLCDDDYATLCKGDYFPVYLPVHSQNPNPCRVGQPVTRYRYTDAAGVPVLEVVRYRYATSRRTSSSGRILLPRWYDAEARSWAWGCSAQALQLYRLPEVVRAVKEGETIYVGEKDVETLRSHGYTATCNPHGVLQWIDRYNDALNGASVVVVPDNDVWGMWHTWHVLAQLEPVASSVKMLRLPGLRPKEDVTDWFAKGHSAADLQEHAAERARRVTPQQKRKHAFTCVPPTPRWRLFGDPACNLESAP